MTPDFEPTQTPEDGHPAAPAADAAAAAPAIAPAPAPAPAASTTVNISPDQSRLETELAQVTGELMRDRRTERRWRLFGRAAWFLLALAVIWGLVTSQRGKASTPNGPHTALVDVRGEIASEDSASAENIISALRSAFD